MAGTKNVIQLSNCKHEFVHGVFVLGGRRSGSGPGVFNKEDQSFWVNEKKVFDSGITVAGQFEEHATERAKRYKHFQSVDNPFDRSIAIPFDVRQTIQSMYEEPLVDPSPSQYASVLSFSGRSLRLTGLEVKSFFGMTLQEIIAEYGLHDSVTESPGT